MKYHFDNEKDWGNTEYKKGFYHMTSTKIKKYATQLKFRIIEGNGKAIYIIGLEDDGNIIGIKKKQLHNYKNIMIKICQEINAGILSCEIIDISKSCKLMIFNLYNLFPLDDGIYLIG